MAKATFNYFCKLNLNFIECNECTMPQLIRYYWELKHTMFMKVHEEGTSKFITMRANQLREDLKKDNPKHNKLLNN